MRRTRPNCRSLITGLLLTPLGAGAAPLADGLRDCRQIADDAQRLHCYDALRSADQTDPAPEPSADAELAEQQRKLAAERADLAAQREALAADRRSHAERAREALANPDRDMLIAAFGAENLPDERRPPIPGKRLDSYEATVSRISNWRRDQLLIRLDNGQLWRQTDYSHLELDPGETGQRVILDRGWLGSYWLINADNELRARVLREE